eukprot:TRINITY_DN5321_c0_g1_i1.p1 TRINITY_DN5321_c0_g1~~TRINITY_DN5321_c0_g1_i1.p1  ORF type:complete len:1033 (-),score=293.27 TRINITY_DN5321_c0_g1_i1:235-3138(-)
MALATTMNCLEALGVDDKLLQKLLEWSKTRSITLRFTAEQKTKFNRKTTEKIESPTYHTDIGRGAVEIKERSVYYMDYYFWDFDHLFELALFPGNSLDEKVVIGSASGSTSIRTTSDVSPRPPVYVEPPIDINLTWFLKNINEKLQFNFAVDRSKKSCRTPRRNDQVEAAIEFMSNRLPKWADSVRKYLSTLFPIISYTYSYYSYTTFIPIVPILESFINSASSSSSTTAGLVQIPGYKANSNRYSILSLGDCNALLDRHRSGILACSSYYRKYGHGATIHEVVANFSLISDHYLESVAFTESLLYNKLMTAIGKNISVGEFYGLMHHHIRDLFALGHEPRKLCYPIRLPDHSPEGIVSILARVHGSLAFPIPSHVRHSVATTPMKFAIDASTKIKFLGDRFVHGLMLQEFSGESGLSLELNAYSRQFCSFILVLGTIVSKDVLDPTYAILIQNKDDLTIMLSLETIPSAKEFKEAISSLSPEQQRFAKAIRNMQLSGTLFAMCIIQVKPQLEKVLNLPFDSLTKEIRMTQDLIELLVKYQIPSDLLSYSGELTESTENKVETVKEQIDEVYAMVDSTKKREILSKARMAILAKPKPPPAPPVQISPYPVPSPPTTTAVLSRVGVVSAPLRSAPGGIPSPKGGRGGLSTQVRKKSSALDDMFSMAKASPVKSRSSATTTSSISSSIPLPSAPMSRESSTTSSSSARPSSSLLSLASVQSNTISAPVSLSKKMEEPSLSIDFDMSADIVSEGAAPEIDDAGEPEPEPTNEESSVDQDSSADSSDASKNTEIVKSKSKVVDAEDYTKIPTKLDDLFGKHDEDGGVRPVIIKPSSNWKRTQQKSLLAHPSTSNLAKPEQEKERKIAFDLLDGLTKSGAIPIEYASLHVIIGMSHTFSQSIIDTVIKENRNPVEKIEKSVLLLSSTIKQLPVEEIVNPHESERIRTYSSDIFKLTPAPSTPSTTDAKLLSS